MPPDAPPCALMDVGAAVTLYTLDQRTALHYETCRRSFGSGSVVGFYPYCVVDLGAGRHLARVLNDRSSYRYRSTLKQQCSSVDVCIFDFKLELNGHHDHNANINDNDLGGIRTLPQVFTQEQSSDGINVHSCEPRGTVGYCSPRIDGGLHGLCFFDPSSHSSLSRRRSRARVCGKVRRCNLPPAYPYTPPVWTTRIAV